MNVNLKIRFLQDYIRKNHKKLFELSPEKVVGIRIDKKTVREDKKTGRTKRPYSIVFQVNTKVAEQKLKPSKVLPKYLEIKFPDRVRRIPTDVEETGRPGFQLSRCRKRNSDSSVEEGTIGVFLVDEDNECYGLTNYHVVAGERMKEGQFEFSGSDKNVMVDNKKAEFVEGILSEELDIAFILCPGVDDIEFVNELSEEVTIDSYIKGPIPLSLKNRIVSVYKGASNQVRTARINNTAAIFDSGIGGLKLLDVIQLTPRVTDKGNSGCPVMIDNSIIGIITGADKKYSYVIPYFKIKNFTNLVIL